jgi:transcriptional regulator with XRE-family HTH domain
MDPFLLNEDQLIENIINKLQMCMKRTGMNLHNLASTLGFQYQPFYRLIKNKKLPAMSSLIKIANYLNYSLGDFLSDKIKVEINILNNLNEFYEGSKKNLLGEVKIPYNYVSKYVCSTFYGLTTNEVDNLIIAKIYVTIDSVDTDGYYIVKYNNKIIQLKIISISSTFLIIEDNAQEVKVSINDVSPIAKLIGEALIHKNNYNYLY